MATTKLMLNKARRLNNGTYPVVMQIIQGRQKKLIYSKLRLHHDEFDPHTGLVKRGRSCYRTLKEIKEYNKTLRDFVRNVEMALHQCQQSHRAYTLDDIYFQYTSIVGGGSFYSFWETLIERLRRQERYGMANAQYSTFRSVKRYCGAAPFSFSHLTTAFIDGYVENLRVQGLSANTISFYIRNFKSAYNLSIHEGCFSHPKSDIFANTESTPRKTVKRALCRETLRKLNGLDLSSDTDLQLARDLFMFSFYTRGMAFVDIVFLRVDAIYQNTIVYNRRKTGQRLRIYINDPISVLLERYVGATEFIFPVLFQDDTLGQYAQYKSALRRVNKNLKLIQEQLRIDSPLTTYVARHSWATQAKEQGVPLSVISEGLGHTSEQITQIYLKEFDQSIIDKANDMISQL